MKEEKGVTGFQDLRIAETNKGIEQFSCTEWGWGWGWGWHKMDSNLGTLQPETWCYSSMEDIVAVARRNNSAKTIKYTTKISNQKYFCFQFQTSIKLLPKCTNHVRCVSRISAYQNQSIQKMDKCKKISCLFIFLDVFDCFTRMLSKKMHTEEKVEAYFFHEHLTVPYM